MRIRCTPIEPNTWEVYAAGVYRGTVTIDIVSSWQSYQWGGMIVEDFRMDQVWRPQGSRVGLFRKPEYHHMMEAVAHLVGKDPTTLTRNNVTIEWQYFD